MNARTPIGLLELLLESVQSTDSSPDFGSSHEDAICDEAGCREDRERVVLVDPAEAPELVDVSAKAAKATYSSGSLKGKLKRTLYPRNVLRRRQVVIGLHQMGVELRTTWPSWWKVTAHYVVRPDGSIAKVHPVDVRLVSTNRVDRSPYACIAIEFAGNFEGLEGSGNWAWPDRNGRGRLGLQQERSGRWLVRRICVEVDNVGGEVVGIVPHCTTGRDEHGRPNRQICPGSAIWSRVGERSAAELGLAVPGPTWKAGGIVIPESWHGAHWGQVSRYLPNV